MHARIYKSFYIVIYRDTRYTDVCKKNGQADLYSSVHIHIYCINCIFSSAPNMLKHDFVAAISLPISFRHKTYRSKKFQLITNSYVLSKNYYSFLKNMNYGIPLNRVEATRVHWHICCLTSFSPVRRRNDSICRLVQIL